MQTFGFFEVNVNDEHTKYISSRKRLGIKFKGSI